MLTERYSQSRQNCVQSSRQQHRIKTNRVTYSCPRQKTTQTQASTQIASSRRTSLLSTSRNTTIQPQPYGFHQKRRQNRLNSMFRIRKEKLESITKYNRDFFVRLNSQESHYRMAKDKDSQENNLNTFRTVDSRESMELLGPIRLFNGVLGGFQRLTQRDNEQTQKENLPKPAKNQEDFKLFKQPQDCHTPIKLKLKLTPHPQAQTNPSQPFKDKTNKITLLTKSIASRQFFKTPDRLAKLTDRTSRLPDLYALF